MTTPLKGLFSANETNLIMQMTKENESYTSFDHIHHIHQNESYTSFENNRVKNPNWREADQLAIYKDDRGAEPGTYPEQLQLVVRTGSI